MKTTLSLLSPAAIAAALVLALHPAAAADPPRLEDRAGKYSFQAPDFPVPDSAPMVQRLVVFAPQEGGFAPNLNVQIQNGKRSRDAYLKTTLEELKTAGLKVRKQELKTVSNLPAILIDYEGSMQGQNLRFLALAVIGADRVWLATGTAPAASFPRYEAEFRKALASFAVQP